MPIPVATTAPIAAASVGEPKPPTIVPMITKGMVSIGSASRSAANRARQLSFSPRG